MLCVNLLSDITNGIQDNRREMTQIFKRGYSRGGCRECKRRKRKCDETKPFCSECTRLGKDCCYPTVGEKVLRGPRKSNGENTALHRKRIWNVQMYTGPHQPRKSFKWEVVSSAEVSKGRADNRVVDTKGSTGRGADSSLILDDTYLHETVRNPIDVKNHQPLDVEILQERSVVQQETNNEKSVEKVQDGETDSFENVEKFHQTEDKMHSQKGLNFTRRAHQGAAQSTSTDNPSPSFLCPSELYNGDDLNLLALDLSNLVNGIIFNSNIVPTNDQDVARTNIDAEVNQNATNVPSCISDEFLIDKSNEEREYVRQFCERFTFQKLPFGVDNKNPSVYRNAIREVVMKHAVKEPFLLAAVMSQGAYSSSELQKDEILRQHDLENCGKYLNNCLQLLLPALNQAQKSGVEWDVTSNIENILLTVLSLAMSNACNEKQSWRPHLQGAREIIMKATSSKIRSSSTLIVCKMWFADFEILAGLSSEMGGTLRTKEQMDLVFNFDPYEQSVLKDFGLIQENGFCVVTGYHIECLGYFRKVCDLLRWKRDFPNDVIDPLEYMHLICEFYSQYEVRFTSVEETPTTGQIFSGALCEEVQKPDGTIEIVSWMDISQQAFTLAGLITIFTRLLGNPLDSQHIKGLVSKIVDLVKIFQDCKLQDSTRFPYAFSMIQWPLSVAGFTCTDSPQFSVIENFFEMCSQTGSNSAKFTLQRIRKAWDSREKGEDIDGTEVGKVDVIAY
ncbi:hypothetical protein KGF57_004996 [Candida theae]|uniref:Zn(2)-C6 fungal-type domain-containing protein n=1 Tax=Candida theae TaxID=1198502 RepID=A0AAD5BAL6_9ASCO|nr:uncharacterized protein KGF57_004996 [Candida theae]KAI5949034.1 hypothetical protein KGF57_004996 [Candida theae]